MVNHKTNPMLLEVAGMVFGSRRNLSIVRASLVQTNYR